MSTLLERYKTQSEDTSIEAERVQFGLWRKMTPAQKQEHFKRLFKKGNKLVLIGISHQFHQASLAEIKLQYLSRKNRHIEADFLTKFKYKGNLMIEDPIWLAHHLAVILDELNIPYYIGGSVASSLQGELRYTEDLDLVINILPPQMQSLIDAMSTEFYISEVAVEEAVTGRTSYFNIIHLETVEKADIFVMRSDGFSLAKMARRQLYISEGNEDNSFYVCTPEDTVLQKLVWFRMTARESQKQWRDVLGVLKLQGEQLDFDYLRQWAENLKLTDLLIQSLGEAGIVNC